MDIEALRIFVEVADAGGVSPAARRLNLSKSIVSRRLVRLEEELGVQLVARTTRGAALTEAGETFRDHAARAFAEIDEARETMLPAGDLHGRLRVAAPLSSDQLISRPCWLRWRCFIPGSTFIPATRTVSLILSRRDSIAGFGSERWKIPI